MFGIDLWPRLGAMDMSDPANKAESAPESGAESDSLNLPVHEFEYHEVVTVAMLGAHALAYQDWLRSNGLFLFRVPDTPELGKVYAVGAVHL